MNNFNGIQLLQGQDTIKYTLQFLGFFLVSTTENQIDVKETSNY